MAAVPLDPSTLRWSGNAASRSIDKTFREVAAEHGARTAIIGSDRNITYAELDALSDRTADLLGALGVRPGENVGLCLGRSAEAIIAMLGILKSGAAYMPIDPSARGATIGHMVDMAGIRVAVASSEAIHELADFGVEVAQVASALPVAILRARSSSSHSFKCGGNDGAAYLMFTSGTTGAPKGVRVPQGGVLRLVCNPDYISLDPSRVILQMAPLSFDASTFEIWAALLNGGTMVIYPEQPIDLGLLDHLILSQRINTMWLTAPLFHTVARHRIKLFRTVDTVMSGGDIVDARHVRRLLETHPGITFINGYGPTENTTFTCCHVVRTAADIGAEVPIGKPISGTRVWVLDEQMQEVPDDEVGELYCGGAGLAAGYVGAPELTAQRFVAAPWNPSDSLYRTGDFVTRRRDGVLMFVGRRDNEVKLRGHRISLTAVRQVLAGIEGIENVFLDFTRNVQGNRLTARVILEEETSMTSSEVKACAAELMPVHQLPDVFEVRNRKVLKRNGKIDVEATFASTRTPIS
ncbi:MAG: amino acid adenylation domain-containing protein [Inquilinus sp.]|nr:amino acid adenylation domain-containing protein [Inquilinus sp.]